MRRGVFVVLVTFACDRGPDTPAREATPAPATFDAAATAAVPASTAGPATEATRAAREAAVLELLAGGTPARYPVVDVDAGSSFDRNLRDAVAPRIVRSRSSEPAVRMSPPAVKGSLDKDIVRRVVRSHINEVRYCYAQTLVVAADLTGKLQVSFTVAPTGEVDNAAIALSSLPGELGKRVSECTIKAVKRWKFPKPPDGKPVDVLFPFVLAPS